MTEHDLAATLWGDAVAPLTSSIGFVRAPLDMVVDGLATWRTALHGSVAVERLPGGLRDHVTTLEPLTAGVGPRELVVGTANPEWTAVLDCGYPHGDPVSTVLYLTRTLQLYGVVITSIPEAKDPDGPARYGSRKLEMLGPVRTDFLNYVRTISVVQDGRRWRFDANGTVQDFEDLEAYGRRRIAERFTASMLVDYAAALGLRPFDEDFYPGPSVLVRNPAVARPGAFVLSLHDAQQRLGIEPAR
ncbi:hypothetical protein [Cellulomonas septica]|uniref:DUF4261 domain-containing protein n=1 Tax=Cellulomonas septica TaxID=285080 RepID=A0ABX1JXZ8_9CELL|nr:hypothetical protein [Cellulomonas septica]NKY39206.1 hypothetical protein [Cellulomonas septica]